MTAVGAISESLLSSLRNVTMDSEIVSAVVISSKVDYLNL